jgi:hypothetical protein
LGTGGCFEDVFRFAEPDARAFRRMDVARSEPLGTIETQQALLTLRVCCHRL